MSPCLKIILPCEYFRMFLTCCPEASQAVRKRKTHAIVSYPAVCGTLKASLKLNRIVLKDNCSKNDSESRQRIRGSMPLQFFKFC